MRTDAWTLTSTGAHRMIAVGLVATGHTTFFLHGVWVRWVMGVQVGAKFFDVEHTWGLVAIPKDGGSSGSGNGAGSADIAWN